MKLKRHIFLIGFMGSGKSTIGKIISSELDRPFIDTDQQIENKVHKTIPEIFNIYGEPKFRKLEEEIISTLFHYLPSIIALGGGAILSSQNRNTIKNLGLSIYLKWSIETLYERLQQSLTRPLVQSVAHQQLFNYISSMLNSRSQYYEQADIIIKGDEFADINELTTAIIKKLEITELYEICLI